MITRVAVVQAGSVMMDREATLAKASRLIREAAAGGAKLVLFPEAFIPAYPWGMSFGAVVGSRTDAGRRLWRRYWANSVEVPGPATEALGALAREAQVFVAMGVVERGSDPGRGTLYCTLLYFGPDGRLLGKHRKLKPTAQERVIWGEGDGSTLTVLDTEIGRVGGLICWENYMPLARAAMYAKGVEIYLAPTADELETWQATIRHIAREGRCFVLGCNQFVTKAMFPADLECRDEVERQPEVISPGGSAIVSPLGAYLAGPLWNEEGILYADLDHDQIAEGRMDMDVVGHYARPDVFRLIVNERPQHTVEFE